MAESGAADVVLGSASPRRAALLEQAGVRFVVCPVDIDENGLVDGRAGAPAVATRIAEAKMAALRRRVEHEPHAAARFLLTADTVVACAGRLLGKPADRDELTGMLETVSGRELEIATAVTVADADNPDAPARTRVVATEVGLHPLTRGEITGYVASGAGDDKAGGLELQGGAAPFIATLAGCWSNVVGLPLCAVTELLDVAATPIPAASRCEPALCGSRPRR